MSHNCGGPALGQSQRHVYVVDDDAAFLSAISRLIHVCGFGVTSCGSIAELCTYSPFVAESCVLADVLLDGESGVDIPDRLAALKQETPVLFMSATDDEAVIRNAERNSVLPCLKKPIELQDLLDAFEVVFRTLDARQNKNI